MPSLREQWAETEALQAGGTHPGQHRINSSAFRKMCSVWCSGDNISLPDGISEQCAP